MSKPPSIVAPPSLVSRVGRNLLHPERVYQRAHRSSRQRWKRHWKTRSFEPEDLLPIPEGYLVRPPDFVGIACAKAGTSWWYQLLLDHPAIVPNRLETKELTYFRHFGHRGPGPAAIDIYRQAFAAPRGCICGEWSPMYLSYPLAINYLAQAAPDTKLLAIVRNPVDRAWSFLNHALSGHARRMNPWRKRACVHDTLSHFRTAVSSGRYYDSFCRLLQVFDRSQLLLLQYEQCTRDPAFEIARTYRFLGVDDSYTPTSLSRRINVKPFTVPWFQPHERAILTDYFSDDVRSLVALFPEIDLSLWPDFEDHRRGDSATHGRK